MEIRLSLIINTAAGDPYVAQIGNLYRRSAYGQRANLLRQILRTGAPGFDEVIVAGVPPTGLAEEFPDVHLVHVPPQLRDRSDALLQREIGARFSSGDFLVFTHDDHTPEPGFADKLRNLGFSEWDILVPERRHALTGAVLENGLSQGYVGGHTLVFRRPAWATTPWTTVATGWWDRPLTRIWRSRGTRVAWTSELVHLDIEALEDER